MRINLFSYTKTLWDSKCLSKQKYKVIYSRDSTPRWMFPVSSKDPLFLKTYSGVGFVNDLVKFIIELFFSLRIAHLVLGKFFSPGFSLNSEILKIIDDYKIIDYGIFLGTIGDNRKTIFVLKSESGMIYFLKYYTSEKSKKLIQKESELLWSFKNNNLKVKVPNVVESSNSMILIESLGDTITQINYDSKEINYFTIERPFKENLLVDRPLKSVFLEKNIINITKADKVLQSLVLNYFVKNEDNIILFCPGHGDFTPWNVFYTDSEKIIILDWELSSNFPLFYDYFHFKIQSLIMLSKLSSDDILNKLDLSFLNKKVLEISNTEIEVLDYLIIYLISIMNFYIPIYQKQENLHWQGERSIKIWGEILFKLLENEDYYRKSYK
jgi:hypothetical protein